MPTRKWLHLAWASLFILGCLFATSLGRLVLQRRAVETSARATCLRQAQDAARSVNDLLVSMETLVHGVARDLESGKIRPRELPPRLEEALGKASLSASRVGVLFQPFAAVQSQRLFGPYVERRGKAFRRFDYEASGDYTQLQWFQYDLGVTSWNEPHRDPATGDLLVDYSEPFRLPGAPAVSGVVRLEVTMKGIQKLVGSLAPGSSGYGFLLSSKGVYLADPLDVRVRNGATFEGVAREMKDEARLAILPSIQAHKAGFAESTSALTGQNTWMFLEPVAAAGWSLGTMIIKDELVLLPQDLNRAMIRMVSLALGFSLSALLLFLGYRKPDGKRPWIASVVGSLLISTGTCFLWHFAYTLHAGPRSHEVEVMSEAGRDAFVEKYAKLGAGFKEVSSVFVPTGIFIQQMEMSGDSLMKISGQVWEKFPKGLSEEHQGLSFPEAVSCDVGPGSAKEVGDDLVYIHSFKGIFPMQADSTLNYPFDRSSVRLRIWPRQVYSNVVLVPDLEAYTILVPVALPGIDKGLSLSGWHLGQSHFSFLTQSYNTNFGIPDFAGQQENPELAYTFTLKRDFTNPFIATFLPIIVVAGLLFTLLLTTTRSKERVAATGYNAVNILRAVISLFFPVVVAQINLRNHILTDGLLYVEYYYFVIYCLILLVAMNSLAVAFWENPTLQRDDNRLAKLLFWPVLSTTFYGISTLYLL